MSPAATRNTAYHNANDSDGNDNHENETSNTHAHYKSNRDYWTTYCRER